MSLDNTIKIYDIVLLFAIPTALGCLHFFLPDHLHSQLVFRYGESGIIEAWTSAYLHNSNAHLYNNIGGYAIGAGFTYYIYATHLQQQQRFWKTVGTLVVVTPFITAAVDYAILYRYTELISAGVVSQGFSGIVSALGGMLLIAVGLQVADEYDTMVGAHTTLLIFLVAFAVLAIVNQIITPLIAGLLIVGVGLLGSQYVSDADLRQPSRVHQRVRENALILAQIVCYGGVFCVFVFLMLPVDVIQGGNFLNIIAHAVGLITGILVSVGVAACELPR